MRIVLGYATYGAQTRSVEEIKEEEVISLAVFDALRKETNARGEPLAKEFRKMVVPNATYFCCRTINPLSRKLREESKKKSGRWDTTPDTLLEARAKVTNRNI